MGGIPRIEPRIGDYSRADYITQARVLCGLPLHVRAIGVVYDYATYTASGAENDVKRALEYWLRAPAATPRQWGAFDPSDFPDSPLGLLLQAACARVRIALGLRVHQSFLAALTSSSQRTLRNHIEAGSLVCEDPTGKHREWITAKSAQAWIESRQK